jgi:type 2 lantibiotic biosynthesis protein LanM
VLPPHWWAAGLALAERLPGTPRAGTADRHALDRLDRWAEVHGVAGFAQRLGRQGLDRDLLLGLLAEPVAELAGRRTEPAWARFVTEVIANAPQAPVPTQRFTGLETLAPALLPFVTLTTARLRVWIGDAGMAALDVDRVCSGFAAQLRRRLVSIAARTLVLELHSATLSASAPDERFAEFVTGVGTASGLTGLISRYPVLGRLLGQTCLGALDAHCEILVRFADDRGALVRSILAGTDPGVLLTVDTGTGDRHRGGRSVAVLGFADTRLVYKPRQGDVQDRFHDILTWLNSRLPGLDLRIARSLARPGFSWQEYIEHQPCADDGGADRFYHRQGALLALLYVLGGTDIHYENVIAAGDQPVLVDVETLFQPAFLRPSATGTDPAARVLADSVAATALLPVLLMGQHGGLDVSGLGGDRDADLPDDVVSFADAGTDRMRLVRTVGRSVGAANRPMIGTEVVDPRRHLATLVAGFRSAYRVIADSRVRLLSADGLVSRCADVEIRVLARSTRDYVELLDESTHPDVLRDALDRDALFDSLWIEPPNELAARVIEPETADLWQGDVPFFRSAPGSPDVIDARGGTVSDALECAGMSRVVARLHRLGELDRGRQEWVIRASMAIRAPGARHTADAGVSGGTAVVPDPERMLSAACGIADEIIAQAIDDGRRVNWLGVQQVHGEHWSVLPMCAALGEGYLGVALFLAQLGSLTGINRYLDVARRAVAPIPLLLAGLTDDPEQVAIAGCGGFHGLGGIGYALARLRVLLDDSDLVDWLTTIVPLIGAAGTTTNEPDLAGGLAGGVTSLLTVHAQTGDPAAAYWADVLADRLADMDVSRTGFLHGRDGVRWALARAGVRAPVTTAEPVPDDGWCHGLAGRLLADDEPADQLIRRLDARRPGRDLSLCHGEMGILDALNVLGRTNPTAREARDRGAAFLLGALERFGPGCGTPDGVPSPGLLTGSAGIGYGLLRLGFADRVPSVLLLEPMPPGRAIRRTY